MVVERHLPELLLVPDPKTMRGPLLESVHEFQKIGVEGTPLQQKMQMVRHQAESLDKEQVPRALFLQHSQHPIAKCLPAEIVHPVMGADGYEIPAATEIVLWTKPDVLVLASPFHCAVPPSQYISYSYSN